jgi:N utilization substance protein B
MTRRQARENSFIAMFSISFSGTALPDAIDASREVGEFVVDAFGEWLLNLYHTHAEEIDREIESRLKRWRVERLPRVSLAILRLSVAEMRYGPPEMDSVVINEAVELAKKYGDEQDYQFINGVLGVISRTGDTAVSAAEDE